MIVKKLKIYAKPSDRENTINTGIKLTSNRLTRQVNIVIAASVDYLPILKENTNYTIPLDGYLYFGWTPSRHVSVWYRWDTGVTLNNTTCLYTTKADAAIRNYGLIGNNIIFAVYYQVRKNTTFSLWQTHKFPGEAVNTCRFAFLKFSRPSSRFNKTSIPLSIFDITNIDGLDVGTAKIVMAKIDRNILKQYGIPTSVYVKP